MWPSPTCLSPTFISPDLGPSLSPFSQRGADLDALRHKVEHAPHRVNRTRAPSAPSISAQAPRRATLPRAPPPLDPFTSMESPSSPYGYGAEGADGLLLALPGRPQAQRRI